MAIALPSSTPLFLHSLSVASLRFQTDPTSSFPTSCAHFLGACLPPPGSGLCSLHLPCWLTICPAAPVYFEPLGSQWEGSLSTGIPMTLALCNQKTHTQHLFPVLKPFQYCSHFTCSTVIWPQSSSTRASWQQPKQLYEDIYTRASSFPFSSVWCVTHPQPMLERCFVMGLVSPI